MQLTATKILQKKVLSGLIRQLDRMTSELEQKISNRGGQLIFLHFEEKTVATLATSWAKFCSDFTIVLGKTFL